MSEGDRGRLKVLVDYWIRHNAEHGEEFKEWAEKARGFGDVALHGDLVAAAEEMERANTALKRARDRL